MKSHVTFLTTPTADTRGTCLLLHFDDKRYLIGNIHEGLQRACIQSNIRLSRVTDIFISGKTEWKNTGGIMGMVLTLADAKNSSPQVQEDLPAKYAHKVKFNARKQPENQSLTIHGGHNVLQTLATARRFIFRKGLPIYVNEHVEGSGVSKDWQPSWMDENIRVWALPISPQVSLANSTEPAQRKTSPISPMKRSFDEFTENDVGGEAHKKADFDSSQSPEMRREEILRGILSHMFQSDWRLDVLYETPLAAVKMPAAIFIRNESTKQLEKYNGPMPGGTDPLPDLNVLVRKAWPGALVEELPGTSPSDIAMSYIIRGHPQRGKFDSKMADALGVPHGPERRELTQGHSVQNHKGEIILPEQVLGPGKPGGGFVVADIPTTDYVTGLLERPEWKSHEIMEGVEAMIWNLGLGVASDSRVQSFIKERHDLKHIVSSPDHSANYLTMDSASVAAIRHNRIDPSRFPIPVHDNTVNPLPSALSDCTIAHRGIKIDIQPAVFLQSPPGPQILNIAEASEVSEDIMKLAHEAWSEINTAAVQAELDQQNLPSSEAEIITLGTGSALPSKYRNVSSTLLRVPGSGSFLFDCGENTIGQLSRLYSPDQLRTVLRDLKMIWISHMHADHHLGITSMIKAWFQEVHAGVTVSKDDGYKNPDEMTKLLAEPNRLFVAAEPHMIHWLREYSQIEHFGFDKLVPLEVPMRKDREPTKLLWNGIDAGFRSTNASLVTAMKAATGLEDFAAVGVAHCYGALGVALTFPDGFKISYSGDCRPSTGFVRIGKGSTVLIHEATFDDELVGDAEAKKHSTTSEAIRVGAGMGASRTVLTHFSQRYQKIPRLQGLENRPVQFEDAHSDEEMDSAATVGTEISEKNSLTALEPIAGPQSSPSKFSPAETLRERILSDQPSNDTNSGIAVAFDLMRIKVKDIVLQEKFTAAFTKLYEEYGDLEAAEKSIERDLEDTEMMNNGGGDYKPLEYSRKDKKKNKKKNEKITRVPKSEQPPPSEIAGRF